MAGVLLVVGCWLLVVGCFGRGLKSDVYIQINTELQR